MLISLYQPLTAARYCPSGELIVTDMPPNQARFSPALLRAAKDAWPVGHSLA